MMPAIHTTMPLALKSLSAALLLLTASCGLPFEQWAGNTKAPLAELDYPGYFDVGIGFGYAAPDFESADGGGVVLSLRAYPAGRWYGTKAKNGKRAAKLLTNILAQNSGSASVLSADALRSAEAQAYYARVFSLPGDEVATRVDKSRNGPRAITKADRKTAVAQRLHTIPAAELTAFLQAIADKVLPKETKFDKDTKLTESDLASFDWDSVDDATKDLRLALMDLVEDPSDDQQAAIIDAARESSGGFEEVEWFVVEDRDRWFHRIAVFYGRSATDFGGSIDSDADLVGLSYDIAPQFSVMAGWGFFDGDDDLSSRYFIGTSLNLNAFREFFGSVLGKE